MQHSLNISYNIYKKNPCVRVVAFPFQLNPLPITSVFGWPVTDGWCWFALREEYCWLIAGGWFVLREKYCWLVADKPNEPGARLGIL
jgi:hypothetical protein